MKIELEKLQHTFCDRPLLIGGKAMEYYGLREAGADIDFVVSERDHVELRRRYPSAMKDIHGDIGVCVSGFELWNQICRFRYDFLSQNAVQHEGYLVAAVDKLVFLKAMAMRQPKYMRDIELLVEYATDVQYGKRKLP